jgi:hypothetical protein
MAGKYNIAGAQQKQAGDYADTMRTRTAAPPAKTTGVAAAGTGEFVSPLGKALATPPAETESLGDVAARLKKEKAAPKKPAKKRSAVQVLSGE